MVENFVLEDGLVGNTYGEIRFDIQPDPLFSLTGATIDAQVRRKANDDVVIAYSVGSGVTIISEYSFKLDKQDLNFPAGRYYIDFLVKFITGDTITIAGGPWVVSEVITKKTV